MTHVTHYLYGLISGADELLNAFKFAIYYVEETLECQWITLKIDGTGQYPLVYDSVHPSELSSTEANGEQLDVAEVERKMENLWTELLNSLPDDEGRVVLFRHVEDADGSFTDRYFVIDWLVFFL